MIQGFKTDTITFSTPVTLNSPIFTHIFEKIYDRDEILLKKPKKW